MRTRTTLAAAMLLLLVDAEAARGSDNSVEPPAARRLNNLVSELLVVSEIAGPGGEYSLARPSEGWLFVSATYRGRGTVKVVLDKSDRDPIIAHDAEGGNVDEAFRFVATGVHQIRVQCDGDIRVERLIVKGIPELMHCGLGFDPAIKSYGHYDMEFLKRDVLPNVTTLIVPSNIQLSPSAIDAWHRQGKRFIAEVGINAQAQNSKDHFRFWTSFVDKAPFLDGIIINEFIVNNPSTVPRETVSPELKSRMEREQQKHQMYEDVFKRIRADARYKDKLLYAYVGGSGKSLNQEMIGKTFVRSLIDCNYHIALERYLFEVSSQKKSDEALQQFVDGIADWEAKEPGVTQQMVIAFGLFSMPPGGINKQPNVDYHVWMDQQMNTVANDPVLSGIGGLQWWTSILADEETVRFVGRLYRHYAIDGKREMLTRDPLFLTHIQNADSEKGTEAWTLHPAEDGTIAAKSFPRYGRIEGRYMGLGRPADPEHIGDTFLWMKRSEKGPNSFSQKIKNLEPGKLYSMKMFSCNYNDLVQPKTKTMQEANKFIGSVMLEGVDIDPQRSFTEMYASNPEPPIPIWITYHWKVFRARAETATMTVSDWPSDEPPTSPFGQEQTFNFLEIQPYHE